VIIESFYICVNDQETMKNKKARNRKFNTMKPGKYNGNKGQLTIKPLNPYFKEVRMLTKVFFGMMVVAVLGTACSSEQPTAPDANSMDQNGAFKNVSNPVSSAGIENSSGDVIDCPIPRGSRMFTVRVENVSTNMTLHLSNGETAPAPNSPGVWAITKWGNPIFKPWRYDPGHGLEQQAEDGNPTMLANYLENDRHVKSTGVFNTPVGDDSPGPATPGKAYEFTVMASPGDRLYLSSMFGQSNDLFYSTGKFGIPMFWGYRPRSGDVTGYFSLWDAGTEVNQEPGLGPDQAPRQSGPNTGESEHQRIHRVHDQYTYPRTNEVIKVTITPVEHVS
jgi:hypothetical protein